MSKIFVSGIFKTRAAAEAAVDAIIKRGYTRDDVSVLMSDSTKNKEFAVQTRSHAADGLGIGGAIGGRLRGPAGGRDRAAGHNPQPAAGSNDAGPLRAAPPARAGRRARRRARVGR